MDLKKIQGFDNMGNTCFMNSALQILVRCSAFTKYMLNNNYESKVLKCYKITLNDYFNPGVNTLEPTIIKRYIADKLPEFIGYRQHDAHEFIIHALDLLDEAIKKEKSNLNSLSSIEPEDVISKLFDCKLYTEIRSLETESKTLIKEPDRIVTLPIPDEKTEPTLDDCFKKYCEVEVLDGDNKWYDEDNNVKVKAEKQMKICNCPKYFIIALKRYNLKGNMLYKINKNILCPLYWNYDKYTYHCRGFVVQSGGLGGGHYIAFIKQDDKWYCCNDSNISEVDEDKIQKIIGSSYILLYVKQKN